LQLVARMNEALNRAGVARTERVVFYDRLAEIHHAILDPATNSNSRRLRAAAAPDATAKLATLIDPRTQIRQRSVKLMRGAWVGMQRDGAQQCRLLWASPLQESYIFRDYSTRDAAQANIILGAGEVEDAFKRGTLSVMDKGSLTQRSIEGTVRAMLAKAPG
jgi:Protein of unknown function (DUF1631)